MEFTNNNLTFVIVTFNSRKVIYDCLNSLPKDFHKLIIENSSDKELKKELEQNYDKTEVILSTNIGMGAANNIGILKSNTQYCEIYKEKIPNEKVNKIKSSLAFLKNKAKTLEDIYKNSKYIIQENKKINYKRLLFKKGVSKISVIGVGMITTPGVTYRMFQALASEKINIQVISTSEIKISVLIDKINTKKALIALHKEFKLENKK